MTFLVLVIFLLLLFAGFYFYKRDIYRKSSYYQVTQNKYGTLDRGQYGEYLIYKKLQYFENLGARFLFNLYIPKSRYESTEIDTLLIHKKGLFVFESKNYQGWIFGDARSNKWLQTFPLGVGRSHREYFYNPIMQNSNHIKYLQRYLKKNLKFHSIIVFSDQSTLKKITTGDSHAYVVRACDVEACVKKICYASQGPDLSPAEIALIYDQLYDLSQASSQEKANHANSVRNIREDWG